LRSGTTAAMRSMKDRLVEHNSIYGELMSDDRSSFVERARARRDAFAWRLAAWAGTVYLGAVSLIGLEAVAILLTFSTAWPIALPVVVLSLGAFYLFRQSIIRGWHHLRTGRTSRR